MYEMERGSSFVHPAGCQIAAYEAVEHLRLPRSATLSLEDDTRLLRSRLTRSEVPNPAEASA